jgi:hypothetical protein
MVDFKMNFSKNRTQHPQTNSEKRKFISENRPLIENIESGCELMILSRRTYLLLQAEEKTF